VVPGHVCILQLAEALKVALELGLGHGGRDARDKNAGGARGHGLSLAHTSRHQRGVCACVRACVRVRMCVYVRAHACKGFTSVCLGLAQAKHALPLGPDQHTLCALLQPPMELFSGLRALH